MLNDAGTKQNKLASWSRKYSFLEVKTASQLDSLFIKI